MKDFWKTKQLDLAFQKNWGWFLAWGIILVIIGITAISAATLFTLVSIFLLGTLLLAGGIVSIIDSFVFWWRKWLGFILHLLLAILYIAAGIMLMYRPIAGAVSITLMLGIFYLILGCLRIIYFIATKTPLWGWGLMNGIISLILGILILASWPSSSFYILGLFIGIDLLFWGWSYIMASIAAHTRRLAS